MRRSGSSPACAASTSSPRRSSPPTATSIISGPSPPRAGREPTGVPFPPLQEEREMLEAAPVRAQIFGFSVDPPPPADRWLHDGDTVTAGGLTFRVVHAPGHSPGHLILLGA